MTSITYVGMDVHTTNYTICCYQMDSSGKERVFGMAELKRDYHEVVKYLNRINNQEGGNCEFVCGYEAGCLGFSLYHKLKSQKTAAAIGIPVAAAV